MSKSDRVYMDFNASAPLLDCAREAMLDVLNAHGNASSVHQEGREAKKLIERARVQTADLIGTTSANVIFTSGATEAANHALSPIMRAGGNEVPILSLYVSATEHPCVLAGGRFSKTAIELLPVLENGLLDQDALTQALKSHDHSAGGALVAVQLANNETGVVQPIQEIAEIAHANNALLLVDAVQAVGKIEVSMADLKADFLLLSGHKIGAPQGVGALVLANGNLSPAPLNLGGGQENYHRGGTENVAAIAGFGAACRWHQGNLKKNLEYYALRDSIEAGLCTISQEAGNEVAQPIFFGKTANRLGNTSCFSVPGVRAETALVALDLEGVSVSSGSACSSGKVKQSHVLAAMGANAEEMESALRISLGWTTTQQDADRFLGAWKTIIGRMAA